MSDHEPGCVRRFPEETPPDIIMDGKPGVHEMFSYVWSYFSGRRFRSMTGRWRTEKKRLRDMLEMRKVELWLDVGTRLG